jgi:hypothetical protein
MIGARKPLLRATLLLAVLGLAAPAHAEVGVFIQVDSEDDFDVAQRIASELASEGYVTDIRASTEPSPCDPEGARLVSVTHETKAWIRLSAQPPGSDTIVASICYLGALPFLQQASPSAPRADPRQLALATAEALNGLRSKLPPLVADPEHSARPSAPTQPAEPPPAAPPGIVNSAVVGTALVLNLPDFPLAPGVAARATLGVTSSVGITLDGFFPTSGREISSDEVTATLRSTYLRVGPRLDAPAGDFELSAAALAGPAVTWASAVAEAPHVGTADVSIGAILSLAAFVEYPRTTPVFACASVSASALLPGAKVDLADGDPPRGSFPVEASIGFGGRWGDVR